MLSQDGTEYIVPAARPRRTQAHESQAPRGFAPRPRAREESARADPALRAAAEELGSVYLNLAGLGYLPLGGWAIPRTIHPLGKSQPSLNSRLMDALRVLKGEAPTSKTETEYIDADRAVKAKLQETALSEAFATLTKQIKELKDFGTRFSREEVAERLSDVADRVRRRVGGFLPSGEDVQRAEAIHGTPDPESDPKYWRLLDESFRARVKSALAVELAVPLPGPPNSRREVADVYKVLSLHPKIVQILDYYSMSPRLGNRLVHELLDEAMAATAKFDATLRVEPEHLWRYPPLVALGIRRLGLSDVPGFPEYAVDLGLLLSRSPIDDALVVAGLAILAVGILLTGPLAVAGLALDATLTGVALTDFAVAGTQGYLTYLREREQDVAAIGGSFRPNRIAERSDYSGSILAGSAALLSGIAFVFSGAKLIKSWRVRKPGTPPPSRPATPKNPPIEEQSAATSNRSLRPTTNQRARFADRERGPFAGPRRSTRSQPDTAEKYVANAPERRGIQNSLKGSESEQKAIPRSSVRTEETLTKNEPTEVRKPGTKRLAIVAPREPLNSVPDPPLLEKAVSPKQYSKREVVEFFKQNRTKYSSDIQRLIEVILPQKDPAWEALERIDKEIRDAHTALANRMAGRVAGNDLPFIRTVRGASNEGGRINRILTDDKLVTLVGQYGSGTAEFDSVEFSTARIVERKLSLKWTARDGSVKWVPPDQVFNQMLHQAEFVQYWKKWSEVRWEVHDLESYQLAVTVHSRLEAIHPDLASRVIVEYFE